MLVNVDVHKNLKPTDISAVLLETITKRFLDMTTTLRFRNASSLDKHIQPVKPIC
jgi:hypothetical protein